MFKEKAHALHGMKTRFIAAARFFFPPSFSLPIYWLLLSSTFKIFFFAPFLNLDRERKRKRWWEISP